MANEVDLSNLAARCRTRRRGACVIPLVGSPGAGVSPDRGSPGKNDEGFKSAGGRGKGWRKGLVFPIYSLYFHSRNH